MKEAAGEANMTIITIVLIAIVLAVGTVIVNGVLSNTKKSSDCSGKGGTWYQGKCCAKPTTNANGEVTGCSSYMTSVNQ